MTKQKFAQELMLRQISGIGLHHTHQDYSSSVINMAMKCLITVQMIDEKVPNFFGGEAVTPNEESTEPT